MPAYDQKELIKVVSVIQKFVTAGISMELVCDHNIVDHVGLEMYNYVLEAHKLGCKAIYYVRSIKRNETVSELIGKEAACIGCAG